MINFHWDKAGWFKVWLLFQHLTRDAIVAVATIFMLRLVERALDGIHLHGWMIYGVEYSAAQIVHYSDLVPLAIVLVSSMWNLLLFVFKGER